jgi:glyoxylase-like metal-dependent hydrolase (beta-lactamase superfamily II)
VTADLAVHAETECHRGIFTISDPLTAYAAHPSITYEPVRDRIWTASEGIYRTIFLEGRRGVVAFDTFYSPGAADAYRHAVNRLLPHKPIETVVYSHDHLDHTGFALDLAPHADVIAHAECAAVVAARASDGQKLPTETWSSPSTQYQIDGVSFELINPGPTHGNGNCAALFPDSGVLFMVDTVIPGVGYTFFPDWHLGSYTAVMRGLLDVGDWDLFVPGHFWTMDRAGFAENLDYCDALGEVAQRALIAGLDADHYSSVDAFARRELRRDFGHLFRFEEYIGMNLMRLMLHYRTGGWGMEDHLEVSSSPARVGREPAGVFTIDADTRQAGAPALSSTALGPGLWTVDCDGYRTVVAEGRDSVVAFNTLGTPGAAQAYGEHIARLAPGKPIETVICTIDHLDHAGYASVLAPDAEIIAHEQTAALIGARGADGPAPVTRVLDGDDELLDLDGVIVRLVFPGPTVGTGNVAAHFPEHGVLFMVGPQAGARYGLLPDFHLERFAHSVATLLELEFSTFVPGRHALTDRAGLERACSYIEGLRHTAQKAFAEGVAVWDIRAMREYAIQVMRGSFGNLDGFDEHIAIGVFRAAHHYLMGGWGLEDSWPPEQE